VKVTERVKARIDLHASLPEPAERRALREAAGLTQQELAVAVGVDRTAIAHWESGRRNPDGKRLDAYVEALRVLKGAA
jgi:transcriptional regulator with XRE-family HTH domain